MTWLPRSASTLAPRTARVADTPGRARGATGPAATLPVTSEAGGPVPGRELPQPTDSPVRMIKTMSRAPRFTNAWTSRISYWFRVRAGPERCRPGPAWFWVALGRSACLLALSMDGAAAQPSLNAVGRYEAVTGPAAVFHLSLLPDEPPISPATQNWLVVPGCGAAAK